MARTDNGLMTLLTVGRNRVLSLVVWFLSCISVHCDVAFVHCDVYFSMFFTVLVRWIDVPLSLLLVHSSVHFSICVDPVLPGVEVLCSGFPLLSSCSVFVVLWATFCQHCATLKMYHMPIERMSYDTIKCRTPFWRSVVRH